MRSLKADGSTRVTKTGEAFFQASRTNLLSTRTNLLSTLRTCRAGLLRLATMERNMCEKICRSHRLGLNNIMDTARYTPAQAHAKMHSRILSELGLSRRSLLLHVSSERWTYSRALDDEWQISSMATSGLADGAAPVN